MYGETKQEVIDGLHKLKNTYFNGAIPDVGAIKVKEFLDQWLVSVKATVARGTYANYDQHVRNLLNPTLGGVRVSKLNAMHVASMYKMLADKGHSTAMQRKAGVSLMAALSWGVSAKLLIDNPAKCVKMPRHEKPEIRILEPEQTAAFLKSARADRLFALYVLAIDSGCRQGEMLALNWRDVDFERRTVSITKSLEEVGGSLAIKSPKTKRAKRTISLSAFTLDALQEHRKAVLSEGSYNPDGPIFCGVRNKTWLRKSDVFRHSFQPILKRAGLSFRFHDLRHACASMLLMTGTDYKTVQERLGHSSPMMTLATYSHCTSGAQAGAAEKLGAILLAASNEVSKSEVG